MRRLYITKSGYWYLVLTIALGVVAIASGNNVLYLIECLLLGGVILSGVVSEKAISSIELVLVRRQAISGRALADELRVRNTSRLPFFCIELLEWSGGEFSPLALVPKIEPLTETAISCSRLFTKRGAHEWQGLAVATAGPFGFARKIRILTAPGRRLVWPESLSGHRQAYAESPHAGHSVADAEVRLFNHDDDARSIVWSLSGKGTDPVVRKKHDEAPDVVLHLDLRVAASERFEDEIRKLAGSVYRARTSSEADVRLLAVGHAGTSRVKGYKPVLDCLAGARAEGPHA